MTPKALSRELKFRVYNTDWKMMVLPEDIYYIKFQGEKSEATDVAFNITTTDGMRNNNIWENPEDIVFMQFTGLHDKNGKEIYEGDIVKVLDRDWSDAEKDTRILIVYYRNDRYILISEIGIEESEKSEPNIYNNEWYEVPLFREYGRDRFEIIGNIYESNELLTKENK